MTTYSLLLVLGGDGQIRNNRPCDLLPVKKRNFERLNNYFGTINYNGTKKQKIKIANSEIKWKSYPCQ